MDTVIKYTNIKEILSRLLRHPMLKGQCSLESAVQYTIDFIGLFGLPEMYTDKETILHIDNYRAILPCDCISIIQVKDCETGLCLRSMTDSFAPSRHQAFEDCSGELTFKTQGNIIFSSYRSHDIKVAYRSIPVDNDGLPLLVDEANYLKTLELYIKKEIFTMLFDEGKINSNVLSNTQQEYAFRAAALGSRYAIPSESEMESLTRMWTTLLPRVTEFDNGFKDLGNREYLVKH